MNPNTPNQEAKRKDIKDYLHLYIGCEVEYEGIINGKELGDERRANKSDIFYIPKVTEIKGTKRGVLKHIEFGVDGKFRRCKIGRKGLQSHYGGDRFKLVLRPISDMTEEEHNKVAELLGYPKPYKMYKKEWFKWYWEGEGHEMFFHPCHVTDVFRYLLSIGIDLFNLIPEGIAIDKTKLKA